MLALPDLRWGRLLAEGGEGRVFELERPQELAGSHVFKQFRQPLPGEEVARLTGYLGQLAGERPGHGARVASSSAWPVLSVAGPRPGLVSGTVMPRAPACFWLSHREGPPRLATLSYLASEPERIELAYGVPTPAAGSAGRVALVYALARLLEAWQASGGQGPGAAPAVAHGDLSAKNVLWSLSPSPAVYVLDCDGARLLVSGAEGGESGRPRATTPNWDDPARAPGGQPGLATDRYALGLVFLRVVGAANFPLQGRQRSAPDVAVDLELPRSWRRLPDRPGLWSLCERALSVVEAAQRPAPGEWVSELEALLELLGAADLAAAVRQAQGDGQPGGLPVPVLSGAPDVVVRPVLRDRAPSTWQLISPRPPVGPRGEMVTASAVFTPLPARQVARRGVVLWAGAHRLAARMARSPGRRAHGVRRMASLLVLDFVVACLGLFLVGMIVSPWVGL